MIGLGLGLLGAALGWGYQKQQERAAEFSRVRELLGTERNTNWQPGQGQGMPALDQLGSTLEGTGLAANPSDPGAQLAFARGLMQVSPRYFAEGSRIMENVLQRQQQAQQFGATEARLSDQFTRSQTQQQSQFEQSQARQAEQFERSYGLDARRVQIAELESARQAAARAAQAGGDGEAPFKVPSGYQPWVDPVTGLQGVAPIAGTKPYADAIAHATALERSMGSASALVDNFAGATRQVRGRNVRAGGVGTEAWGPKAAEMGGQRADVIAGIATLRNMGVLQEGEAKRLEASLPDPVGWGYTQTDTFVKAYEEVQRQMRTALAAHYRANPWMAPPPPPGTVPARGGK